MTIFPCAHLCRKSYCVLFLLLLFVLSAKAQAPTITQQPQSLIFCTETTTTASFTISYTASTAGQWEYALAGSNVWLPIVPGVNIWQPSYGYYTAYLTCAVQDSLLGYQFRCVMYVYTDSTVSSIATASYGSLPTPSITDSPLLQIVCAGSSVTLTSSDSVNTVQWYLDDSLVSIGQQYSANAAGNYTVKSSNTFGCLTASSTPDSISLLPLPPVPLVTVTQTNHGAACAPDTATLTIDSLPGCTYHWYYNDDAYPLPFTGVTAFTTLSGLMSVKATGTNGCKISSGDITVSIAPTAAPTSFITSSPAVCQGVQGITYTINPDSAGTTYSWSYSGTGATITGDGTSVTIDFGAGATSGNLSVQDSGYSCPANITLTMPVQVDSIPGEPGPFINPDTLIDIGNAAPEYIYNYTIPSAGQDLDYEWSYSGISQVQTYIDTAATLQFYNASGGGVLSVTASNECGVSPARSLSIQVLLPDTVVSFTARAEGNNVLLNWTTSEEINTGAFILSRSVDSVTWTQLTQVPFSGDLNGNAYSYVDRTPGNGINYYRLEGDPATGNDSTTEDTSITMTISNPTVRVFPNPAVTTLNILFNSGIFQDVEIMDELGNMLLRAPVGSGASELSLPVNNLSGGMYFLRLTGSEGLRKTVMFMKAN